jgi:hypothetical protein
MPPIGGYDNPYVEMSPFGLIVAVHWPQKNIVKVSGTGQFNFGGFNAGPRFAVNGWNTPLTDPFPGGLVIGNDVVTGDVVDDFGAFSIGKSVPVPGDYAAMAVAEIHAGVEQQQPDGSFAIVGPGGVGQLAILDADTFEPLAAGDTVTVPPNGIATASVNLPRQTLLLPSGVAAIGLTVGFRGSPTIDDPISLVIYFPASKFSVTAYAPP